MSKNRRRFTRIKIQRTVVVNLPDGNTFHSKEINDLSIGGCLVPAVTSLEEGTECTVDILLEENQTSPSITIGGKVVRSFEDAVAVNFISIDPDSLFLLQNLIRFNSEDPETIDEEIISRPGIV